MIPKVTVYCPAITLVSFFWQMTIYDELAQNLPCPIIISILTQFFCFLNLRKERIYRKF